MKNITTDIVIIGGGLTGLALGYFLRNSGLSFQIVEARNRLGGRIHTLYNEEEPPIEMGATWLGKKHTFLVELSEELGIGIFEQILGDRAIYEPISTSPPQLVQLPPNTNPSYRIKGGTSTLIKTLASYVSAENIHLNEVVESIDLQKDGVTVKSNSHIYNAGKVVSTLPPNLFNHSISISPSLPVELTKILSTTHTWMGESIKVALTFDKPFWRDERLSGTIMSNVGPIPEMYDHSSVEDTKFALKGFLNGAYFSLSKSERLQLVLRQLGKYYGELVHNYTNYEEAVWSKESYTFTPYDSHILPHQHNGHAIYQQSFFDGKLFIAGSETASQFPGYMDGAVRSAVFVTDLILKDQ